MNHKKIIFILAIIIAIVIAILGAFTIAHKAEAPVASSTSNSIVEEQNNSDITNQQPVQIQFQATSSVKKSKPLPY